MVTAVEPTYGNLNLSTLIEMFIADKQVEGRSRRTLEWYRERLGGFHRFLVGEGIITLDEITLHDGRRYMAHLQSRTELPKDHVSGSGQPRRLSPFTVHGHARALKVFSNWLQAEGYTSEPVFARLKPPKLPEVMIEILSEEEIRRILNTIPPNTALGVRLEAIVLLLLDTGIRASELCTLTLSNTQVDAGYIKVLGKGSKERMVPFGATTRKALLKYIYGFRPEPAFDDVDELILTRRGTPLPYNGFRQVIKRLGQRASVPRLHAHLFRHTFAVRYLMNGGDVMSLKLILGHSTLEVTQMYLHLADSHIQVQHSKFSPVDRLRIGRRRNGT